MPETDVDYAVRMHYMDYTTLEFDLIILISAFNDEMFDWYP